MNIARWIVWTVVGVLVVLVAAVFVLGFNLAKVTAAQPVVTAQVPATPVVQQKAPPEVQPPAAVPTNVPYVPVQSSGTCPQARDLGPWAPTAAGVGLNFEVTASDDPNANLGSNGVVLGAWWPSGNTPWGNQEVTTFVRRGLSVTFLNAGGRGWDYEQNCSLAEIKAQLEQHMHTRSGDTSYHGFVSIDELVQMGLVTVRFDRSATGSGITPSNVSLLPAPSTGNGNTCAATRFGDSDALSTVSAPSGHTYSVEAWGGQIGDAFVVIPAGETVSRTWQGGAIWDYPCSNTSAVIADVSGRGKPVMVVENGNLVTK